MLLLIRLFFLAHWPSKFTAVLAKDVKSILILVDGLRWDKISAANLTGFQQFAQNGARAQHLIPTFPSLAYPNYFSLATGLYAESHGITDDHMFDQETKAFFVRGTSFGPRDNPVKWHTGGEPIWTTAHQQGAKILLDGWPGCKVSSVFPSPHKCLAYQRSANATALLARFESILAGIAEESVDIALVYTDLVSSAGYAHGPSSQEYAQSVHQIDLALRLLWWRLEELKLKDEVNVMIVSVFGMTELTRPPLVINVARYASLLDTTVSFHPGGALLPLHSQRQHMEKLFVSLYHGHSHLKTYWKWTVPEEWHVRNGPRFPPILLVPDDGWAVAPSEKDALFHFRFRGGHHGYDPTDFSDMWGVFLAAGPSFRKNITTPPVHVTDVYNMLCHLSGVTPAANNGSWSRALPLLNNETGTVPEELDSRIVSAPATVDLSTTLAPPTDNYTVLLTVSLWGSTTPKPMLSSTPPQSSVATSGSNHVYAVTSTLDIAGTTDVNVLTKTVTVAAESTTTTVAPALDNLLTLIAEENNGTMWSQITTAGHTSTESEEPNFETTPKSLLVTGTNEKWYDPVSLNETEEFSGEHSLMSPRDNSSDEIYLKEGSTFSNGTVSLSTIADNFAAEPISETGSHDPTEDFSGSGDFAPEEPPVTSDIDLISGKSPSSTTLISTAEAGEFFDPGLVEGSGGVFTGSGDEATDKLSKSSLDVQNALDDYSGSGEALTAPFADKVSKSIENQVGRDFGSGDSSLKLSYDVVDNYSGMESSLLAIKPELVFEKGSGSGQTIVDNFSGRGFMGLENVDYTDTQFSGWNSGDGGLREASGSGTWLKELLDFGHEQYDQNKSGKTYEKESVQIEIGSGIDFSNYLASFESLQDSQSFLEGSGSELHETGSGFAQSGLDQVTDQKGIPIDEVRCSFNPPGESNNTHEMIPFSYKNQTVAIIRSLSAAPKRLMWVTTTVPSHGSKTIFVYRLPSKGTSLSRKLFRSGAGVFEQRSIGNCQPNDLSGDEAEKTFGAVEDEAGIVTSDDLEPESVWWIQQESRSRRITRARISIYRNSRRQVLPPNKRRANRARKPRRKSLRRRQPRGLDWSKLLAEVGAEKFESKPLADASLKPLLDQLAQVSDTLNFYTSGYLGENAPSVSNDGLSTEGFLPVRHRRVAASAQSSRKSHAIEGSGEMEFEPSGHTVVLVSPLTQPKNVIWHRCEDFETCDSEFMDILIADDASDSNSSCVHVRSGQNEPQEIMWVQDSGLSGFKTLHRDKRKRVSVYSNAGDHHHHHHLPNPWHGVGGRRISGRVRQPGHPHTTLFHYRPHRAAPLTVIKTPKISPEKRKSGVVKANGLNVTKKLSSGNMSSVSVTGNFVNFTVLEYKQNVENLELIRKSLAVSEKHHLTVYLPSSNGTSEQNGSVPFSLASGVAYRTVSQKEVSKSEPVANPPVATLVAEGRQPETIIWSCNEEKEPLMRQKRRRLTVYRPDFIRRSSSDSNGRIRFWPGATYTSLFRPRRPQTRKPRDQKTDKSDHLPDISYEGLKLTLEQNSEIEGSGSGLNSDEVFVLETPVQPPESLLWISAEHLKIKDGLANFYCLHSNETKTIIRAVLKRSDKREKRDAPGLQLVQSNRTKTPMLEKNDAVIANNDFEKYGREVEGSVEKEEFHFSGFSEHLIPTNDFSSFFVGHIQSLKMATVVKAYSETEKVGREKRATENRVRHRRHRINRGGRTRLTTPRRQFNFFGTRSRQNHPYQNIGSNGVPRGRIRKYGHSGVLKG